MPTKYHIRNLFLNPLRLSRRMVAVLGVTQYKCIMQTSKQIAGKTVRKPNPILEGLAIANETFTLSNIANQLGKKTCAQDNYILKGWQTIERRIKDDIRNDVTKLILRNPKGYVILVNHFAERFWNKERKTAVEGKTWNLYQNVVVNKGRCSVFFVYLLLAKMAKMDPNEFNGIYNHGNKYIPAAKAKAKATEAVATA